MAARKTQNAQQLAERRSRALSLRLGGASYRDIAGELDVSLRRAYLDVQQELAILDPLKKATAERLRDMEAARLDRWLLTLSERIAAAKDRPSSVSDQSLVSLINVAVSGNAASEAAGSGCADEGRADRRGGTGCANGPALATRAGDARRRDEDLRR